MRKTILWVAAALALIAIPALIGFVALRGGDDGSSSAARRTAAFVQAGGGATAYELQFAGGSPVITAADEAIEVESFSWGITNSATATGTAGKVNVHDLKVIKKVDKASPLLFLAAAKGTHYPKVTLSLMKGTEKPEPYMIYTLEQVLVSSLQHGGNNPNVPTEEVSLNFAKISVKVSDTNRDGTLGEPSIHSYDLEMQVAK